MKSDNISYPEALKIIGIVVVVVAFVAFTIRFSKAAEAEALEEMNKSLEEKANLGKAA